ncbi:hypothetical protein SBA3_4220001 [Candidatus Sulfopaludibacter sp. SbA3]|nr:hypothetical protein SBA3_4220001 [Candidatus Sulfopaludibacter sp. SbA3]
MEDGPYVTMADALAQSGGILPFNRKVFATRPGPDGRQAWYLVAYRPVIRGTDLRDARMAADTLAAPVTTFTLSQQVTRSPRRSRRSP